jgi:3-oxoacyl-[acyl-carrier protein] reductase
MSKQNSTKTAVVTGAASGIGRRTVERLVDEGWTVWALDVTAFTPFATPGAQESNSGVRYEYCDVSDPASVSVAFARIAESTRKLDALICSAGVVRIGALQDQAPKEIDLMLGVNVKGPWLTIREAVPLLREDSSVDNPARVVIVGSIGGIRPKVGSGFYSATKAAVHVLAGIFAVELGPSGILVNAVAPGTTATPMSEGAGATSNSGTAFKLSGPSPLGRIATPDDVVDVILFYLSDAARFVNGSVLPVDGGTRAAFVKN